MSFENQGRITAAALAQLDHIDLTFCQLLSEVANSAILEEDDVCLEKLDKLLSRHDRYKAYKAQYKIADSVYIHYLDPNVRKGFTPDDSSILYDPPPGNVSISECPTLYLDREDIIQVFKAGDPTAASRSFRSRILNNREQEKCPLPDDYLMLWPHPVFL
jgi:hypothetical protein